MSIVVFVDGKVLPQKALDRWELERSRAVARYLRSAFGLSVPAGLFDARQSPDLPAIRAALTEAKLQISPERYRSSLKRRLAFSQASAVFLNMLSRGRLKSSVVEIVCEGCTAEYMFAEIGKLFWTNSPENRALALLGSPDHYVLQAHPGKVQEIVETTGGAPMQSQFFISYGEEPAYPADSDYPLQMTGVARLANGTIVGDIRHQYRNEGRGFRAKLADQFPAIFPKYLIEAHQLHLACEFVIWYEALIARAPVSDRRACA